MNSNVFLVANSEGSKMFQSMIDKMGLSGIVGIVFIGYCLWKLVSHQNMHQTFEVKKIVPQVLIVFSIGACIWKINYALLIGDAIMSTVLKYINYLN
jgi:hypothetical protein